LNRLKPLRQQDTDPTKEGTGQIQTTSEAIEIVHSTSVDALSQMSDRENAGFGQNAGFVWQLNIPVV